MVTAGALLTALITAQEVGVIGTSVLHSRNAHVREGIRFVNGVMNIINPATLIYNSKCLLTG